MDMKNRITEILGWYGVVAIVAEPADAAATVPRLAGLGRAIAVEPDGTAAPLRQRSAQGKRQAQHPDRPRNRQAGESPREDRRGQAQEVFRGQLPAQPGQHFAASFHPFA